MLTIIESESVTINLWLEASIPDERKILLVSADLQARVRAEHAARPLGLRVEASRPERTPPLDPPPLLVILDLDQIDDVAAWMAATDLDRTRVVGFFSHVQKEAGAAAEAAGVEVHRRGRFWRELEQILGELVR